MNQLGNILWFFLGGFIIVLLYLFGSFILVISIVGIPFARQHIKMAGLELIPFGMDIRSVRSSEVSSRQKFSPNGFDGKEICALSRYAGISNKVSSFGIYEYKPSKDNSSCWIIFLARYLVPMNILSWIRFQLH